MKRPIAIAAILLACGAAAWMLWPEFETSEPARTKFSPKATKKLEGVFAGKRGVERLEPAPEGPVPQGQRVLFVTWDTVRADHTSAYGYDRDTTPTLKALGERGVRFEQFIVPQSTTLPTHVSLFTGTHPEEHGVIGNSAGGEHAFVPPEALPTLASHLSSQGYRTAGFVSSAPLKKFSGISHGFQEWSEPASRFRSALATTAAAMDWLDTVDDERPWLLWVHTYDPHAPYQPRKDMKGALGTYDFGPALEAAQLTNHDRWDTTKLSRWRERYDLEIRTNDNELAKLIDTVEQRFPGTLIVVAGDHGEGLGEHDHKEHGLTWPEQLLSPWVMAGPGIDPTVVAEPTTAADVLPTLAAVADLPDEEGLLSMVSGRNALEPIDAERAIMSRTSPRQLQKLQRVAQLDALSWSMTTTRWHMTWSPDRAAELFDRQADPRSLHDVAGDHPDVIAKLTAQLENRRAEMYERATSLGSGRTKALAAETADELRALGYLDP